MQITGQLMMLFSCLKPFFPPEVESVSFQKWNVIKRRINDVMVLRRTAVGVAC